MICVAETSSQTQKLGGLLAKTVLESVPKKNALVLALRGELGAGKTHFTQGFAKGLGIKGTVNSPTFVILKKYPLNAAGFKNFYHIDCYRLDSAANLAPLGIKEILNNPANIVAVEWPDAAQDIFSKDAIKIYFEVVAKNRRRIVIG